MAIVRQIGALNLELLGCPGLLLLGDFPLLENDQKPQFLSFPFAALPPNDFYDPGTISPRCFRASLSVAAVGGGGIGVHEGVFLFESVYLDTI